MQPVQSRFGSRDPQRSSIDRRGFDVVAGYDPTGKIPGGDRATDCIHCGLPLSGEQIDADDPFCCRGCRAVHRLIHNKGLERYYELRNCQTPPPAELRSGNFAWLEEQWEQATKIAGSDTRRLNLDLQGVHCAACVWLLEKLFSRHAGGRSLRINPALGSVELIWDRTAGELTDYLAEVENFGYRFGPLHEAGSRQSRGLLIRLGICVAAAMNVMSFSLSYYFGLSQADPETYSLFGHLNFALAGVALTVGGWPFINAAWRGVKRGLVHLDLPIALGMVLAFAGSTFTYFSQGPEAAYFDTITIFIALMLVGRWLQERVLERNRNALLSSGGIADLHARVMTGAGMQSVPASKLQAGDRLWIAPGDLVPVAGVLQLRSARVSLDWITGEVAPVTMAPGEIVQAGAINASDRGFRINASEGFTSSRLNDLLSPGNTPVEAASGEKGWWHRVATSYVAAVLLLAAVGFGIWLSQGVTRAVEVAVSVLVITCPCALGLALPLGRELVHVNLRRRGVMLRRDDFLDRALKIKQIVFDKTGTVTRGLPGLTLHSRRQLLRLSRGEQEILWNMTSRSNHPLSVCLTEALDEISREGGHSLSLLPSADDSREETGQGLVWSRLAGEYRLGRRSFACGAGQGGVSSRNGGASVNARSIFSLDGRPLLDLDFVEDLRNDAAVEVKALGRAGFTVHLLSGDRSDKVAAVARELGIHKSRVRGDLSPEAKAEAVAELAVEGTMMVGDGLNDSPSFDQALCTATPAVDRAWLPQKADFYFLGDGIGAVRRSLTAARNLRQVQRDNLIFAGLYNLLAVGLCLGGVVSPVVAAILMPLSSVSIVGLTVFRLAKGST